MFALNAVSTVNQNLGSNICIVLLSSPNFCFHYTQFFVILLISVGTRLISAAENEKKKHKGQIEEKINHKFFSRNRRNSSIFYICNCHCSNQPWIV